MQLPSNKTGILFVTVVLVVSSIIGFNANKKNSSPQIQEEDSRPTELTIKIGQTGENNKDSDGDGLFDWQEILLKTDPNNPDTDSDGTNDAQEVEVGRDPTIPGPNDKKTSSENKNEIYENFVPGTLTDEISKNLASNYFNFKQNNEFTLDIRDNLINKISGDVEKLTAPQKVYDKSDILIVEDTKENVREYANILGETQNRYFISMSNIQNNNSEQYLIKLSNSYVRFENEALLMAVPRSLSDNHVMILNNLKNISSATLDLNDYKSDPVRSLFAIKKWQGAQDSQDKIYGQFIIYFRNNDIIFNNDEPGIFWEKFSKLLNV